MMYCPQTTKTKNYLDQMYTVEREIQDTTESNISASSYLDLVLSIGIDGCRGHKYQMAITHKIYSLRGSFPKLTNSLSLKMYSCLIKNEKIILGRLHKVY